MSKQESLIVYGVYAGKPTALEKANRLRDKLRKPHVCSLDDLEAGKVREIPDRVFIVGGDGTTRAAVTWLSDRDCYPTLYLAGGGTLNLLRRHIAKGTSGLAFEKADDFEAIEQASISYRPGEISIDGRRVTSFLVNAGFGEFEKQWAREREKLRKEGKNGLISQYIAGMRALHDISREGRISQGLVLQVFSLNELIGPFRVFSDEAANIQNPLIGLAEIKGENPMIALAKLTLALSCWKLGLRTPPSLVSIQYTDVFKKDGAVHLLDVNADGDIKEVKGEGELLIKKSQKPFMMTVVT